MLWNVATTATFWAIWLERNKRIFEEFQESVDSIWDRIRFWVEYDYFLVKTLKYSFSSSY